MVRAKAGHGRLSVSPRPSTGERDLALEPDILDIFVQDLRRLGVVGEERAAKLLYLTLVSRLLDKPLAVIVKGSSSAGKSYLVDQVLRFFPPEAYLTRTAFSEKAVVHTDESLVHRTLVLCEADGLARGIAAYMVRSLLSEGRLVYEVTKDPSLGTGTTKLEKDGPTGLIVTTTRSHLDRELETRMLSVPITETSEQTKEIILAVGREDMGSVEMEKWVALQQELTGAKVSIPYWRTLATLMPPAEIRMRRDADKVHTLICANALLHQNTRARDHDGHIVATLEDYEVVWNLVGDLIGIEVGTIIPNEVRETAGAVKSIYEKRGGVLVSLNELTEFLDNKSKTTVLRHAREAVEKELLISMDTQGPRGVCYGPGMETPENIEILPSPDRLRKALDAGRLAT